MKNNNYIKNLINTWRDPDLLSKIFFSFAFLTISLIINYYAVRYATANAGEPIRDIILDKIPKINTELVHGTVANLIKIFTIIILILNPRFINFSFKAISLVILIRSIFINLTYLGIPYESNPIQSYYTFGGDLFFSGHVALPFMIALIFWNTKKIRYSYLFISLFMGVEVLLGHYHYTIDVLAAPFITYSIFAWAKKIFKEDAEVLKIDTELPK